MINITELTGPVLKKQLPIKRAKKRYHNKNKSGGNFGFTLMSEEQPDFEMVGYHDRNGTIINLRIKLLWQAGGAILIEKYNKESITMEETMQSATNVIEYHRSL